MNTNDSYLVNRGNSEHPSWENAHWERAHDLAGFHLMRLDMDGIKVVTHSSAIRSMKASATALEAEISRLVEHPGLTADAKKLIQAAIESQRTGKLERSV